MNNKINNKFISKKKTIVYISVLLFTLFTLYSAYSMGSIAQNMYDHPYKVTNTSRAMRSRLIDMKRFVGIFLTSNQNENEIDQLFEERYKMQNEAIDELYNLYLGSMDDIDALKKAMDDLILSQNKAIQYSKTHTNEEILTYINEFVFPFYDVLDSKLDIIINSSDKRIYNMAEKTQLTSHIFLGSSVFFILVIIVLSIYMDKTRYQQFKELLDRETRLEHALKLAKSANDEKNNLEKRLKRENVQLKCAKELYNNHEINIALKNILGYIGTLFSADRAYILLFHNDSFEWCGEGISSQIDNLQNMQINECQIWKKELDTKSNLVIDDIEKIRDVYFDEYKTFSKRGVRNVVWVSFTKDEKIDGIIGLDNPDLNMAEIIVPFLQTIQYFISLSIQRQEDEKMLFELSQIDKLTSFYNRNRFTKDIEEFKKSNNSIGVIYLDINGLKETNDFYGHDVGDQLLKRYANIIKNGASSNNLYRIGGDEFVILYSCIEEDAFYHNVRILKNNFEKNECHIAFGAKWADNSHDIRDIIKFADESMYMDKKKYYQNHHVTTRYRHDND